MSRDYGAAIKLWAVQRHFPVSQGRANLIRLAFPMPTMLEVETELASEIQARAVGISVNVYLRELIKQRG